MSYNQILRKRKINSIISPSHSTKESFNLITNKKTKKIRNNSYAAKSNFKTNNTKNKNFSDLYLSISKINLYLKYKSNEKFEYYLISSLIKKKKGRYNLLFNELKIYNDENDYLRRLYYLTDSKYRIPKYFQYYKNYLEYFCRPFIIGKTTNKILLKHMEKAAEEFYKNNFQDEEKNEQKEKNKITKIYTNIFSQKVIQEIENERLETNEKNKFLKKVKSFDGIIIKENEDISSFFGISKINYQITYYDDSNIKNKKFEQLSIDSILDIIDKEKIKKKEEKKEIKKKEKKIENNNSNSTTFNSNNVSKLNKKEIKNNINNLNLKYISDIFSPKNKIKEYSNNNNNNNNINNNINNIILEKLKESLHFKIKKNISPNKLILNAFNDFIPPFNNIHNIKESNLKYSNSTKNLNSMNSTNKQFSKLTISTNFNPVFQHLIKRPKRGVIFKHNNNHQSINTSSLFLKSPMHIYSTQSRTIRSNSNIVKRKNNSLGNSKNGSHFLSTKQILNKHIDEDTIYNKKKSFNISKKSNDESLKYGNSRNNSHKKIPVINLNKIQSSLDFIKMNRNKLKNINKRKFGNK